MRGYGDMMVNPEPHRGSYRGVYLCHDDMPSETFILGVSFCLTVK